LSHAFWSQATSRTTCKNHKYTYGTNRSLSPPHFSCIKYAFQSQTPPPTTCKNHQYNTYLSHPPCIKYESCRAYHVRINILYVKIKN